MIRNVNIKDVKAIVNIYNYYVKNSIATFDEVDVSIDEFSDKIEKITQKFPFLVYEVDGKVLGYAYANTWNNRCAYNKTAEVSVYLHPENIRKGIGSKFYKLLIDWLKKENFHTVVGGISLPNERSIALHEKFGFEKVAHFKQVGYKFNNWIDVGYWQLILKNKTNNN